MASRPAFSNVSTKHLPFLAVQGGGLWGRKEGERRPGGVTRENRENLPPPMDGQTYVCPLFYPFPPKTKSTHQLAAILASRYRLHPEGFLLFLKPNIMSLRVRKGFRSAFHGDRSMPYGLTTPEYSVAFIMVGTNANRPLPGVRTVYRRRFQVRGGGRAGSRGA